MTGKKWQEFATKHGLTGLTKQTIERLMTESDQKKAIENGKKALVFKGRIANEVMNHAVVRNNPFTAWFKGGDASLDQVRHMFVQFSVFSNQFCIAQLTKCFNSRTLEGARSAKEILIHELGGIFAPRSEEERSDADELIVKDEDVEDLTGVDRANLSTTGSVSGGVFKFAAAHFEWLVKDGSTVGLEFHQMGRRSCGSLATTAFCDRIIELIGSEDETIAQGSSFAIENWANAGFWRELVIGLRGVKKKLCPGLSVGYFLWHDLVEHKHASHTEFESELMFLESELDQDLFIDSCNKMMDALMLFWREMLANCMSLKA